MFRPEDRNIYTSGSICEHHAVRVIRLKIADLYDFEGKPPASNSDADAVSALALKQFSFLPQPLTFLVEGDNVSISFPAPAGGGASSNAVTGGTNQMLIGLVARNCSGATRSTESGRMNTAEINAD
jgi:hypothetical protein